MKDALSYIIRLIMYHGSPMWKKTLSLTVNSQLSCIACKISVTLDPVHWTQVETCLMCCPRENHLILNNRSYNDESCVTHVEDGDNASCVSHVEDACFLLT